MRVFDTYQYILKDIVKYKDTQEYIENMLSELDLSYKHIIFSLGANNDDVRKKAVERFPSLDKYSYHGNDHHGLTSIKSDSPDESIYANPDDAKAILTVASKIPRTFDFWRGDIILDGVNWFEDSSDELVVKHRTSRSFEHYSNRIVRGISGGGYSLNSVSVCIEVTAEPEPRNSRLILDKLRPYFGDPYIMPHVNPRTCVFSEEEEEQFSRLHKEHWQRLKELGDSLLPEYKRRPPMFIGDLYIPHEKIPHVADKATNNKAFKGTDFERQKGTPNWLHVYSCLDKNGFKYEANIQKLSGGDEFRFDINISGYNFRINYKHSDYTVTEEGESLDIIKEIAAFCVKLRDEYSTELVRDFGKTPDWYYTF